MEIEKITSGEELERTKQKGVALIDFGASWCAPCRLQEPIMRRLATQFEGRASFAAVNIDENREAAINLGIRGVPTLILFQNGKEVLRFVGLQSEAALSEALDKLIH